MLHWPLPPFRINAADDLTTIRNDDVTKKTSKLKRSSADMLKEDKRMKANHQDLQAINAKKKAAKNILNAEIFERHTTQKNIDRLFGRASTKSR